MNSVIGTDARSLPLVENSQIGDARRQAVAMAQALGFDSTGAGEVAIVVSELATNLVRHAQGGQLVLQPVDDGCSRAGLEILAIDHGPGIANVGAALRDGFTTGTTPGTGLGAVRRLSAEFDLYSNDAGTVVMSRLWAAPVPDIPITLRESVIVGVVCLPKAGEDACGDAWVLIPQSIGRVMVVVADGLGHGQGASDASRAAIEACHANLRLEPVRRMEAIHAALRSTRGAAVSIAELRTDRGQISFTGVGNVAGCILSGNAVRCLVSHNGTVGVEARRIQEFVEPWPPDALLIMHSDGLATQWRLDRYAGLQNRHPAVIAAVLYRDFRRERDDVTVLVARAAESAER